MSRGFDEDMLSVVDDLLGRGVPRAKIVSQVAHEFSAERRVVKRALDEVLRRWGARVEDATPDEQRSQLVGMTASLYQECRQLKHHKSALSCIDTMARLLGLTRPDVLAVTGVLDGRGALTSTDEVRKRLDELRRRQLGAGGTGEGNDGGGEDPDPN